MTALTFNPVALKSRQWRTVTRRTSKTEHNESDVGALWPRLKVADQTIFLRTLKRIVLLASQRGSGLEALPPSSKEGPLNTISVTVFALSG